MKKTVGLLLACLAGLWAATIPATAAVEDSVNADKAAGAIGWWGPTNDVGWLYTPKFAYELTGVETRFDQSPEPGTHPMTRTVTVEIYDALPTEGGNLLRSADFIYHTGDSGFEGGNFASLPLEAGTSYFVAFRNVTRLGANITWDDTATRLSPIYFDEMDINGKTDVPFSHVDDGHMLGNRSSTQPILQFLGEPIDSPSPAPEPAGVMLLGLGVLPLLRRRPRTA